MSSTNSMINTAAFIYTPRKNKFLGVDNTKVVE